MASKSETAIKFARVIAAKDKRISELEAKLAALDWSPITESNLPKVGDEVLYGNGTRVSPVICEYEFDVWEANKDTHFRAINPPPPEKP